MTLDIDVKHRGKAFWVKGFLEGDSYSPVIRKRFTAKEDAVSYATGLVDGYGLAIRQLGRPGWVMSDDTAEDGDASYDFDPDKDLVEGRRVRFAQREYNSG